MSNKARGSGAPPQSLSRALLALLLCAAAFAQDRALERVELRVSSIGTDAAVTVDRGRSDGLAIGDRVLFYPVGGGTYTGTVLSVDDRSAVVELHDRKVVPAAGTRGEVLIPLERLAREEKEERAKEQAKAKPVPEHPPWENKDEGFTPDQPLLAKMKPVRPEDRPGRLSGRAYFIGEAIQGSEADLDSINLRGGFDALYENLMGTGGDLRVNAELDYFTNVDDTEDMNLLVRWFSYVHGGNRFESTRWEVGRFLQYGMPEFEIIDGGEWGHRRTNGHRYGVSAGFMPELDQDFQSFIDFQAAAYYQWVSGPREELTVTVGFQQTWHQGDLDRDLLVVKFRRMPMKGWDFTGTIWLDFYTNDDNIKSGVDVTQAVLTANKRYLDGSGFTVTYQHIEYPELLRQGEFTPITAAEIADNRMDKLATNFWWWVREGAQVHGYVSGWIDEQDEGGAAELGIEVRDLLVRNSRFDITGFGGIGNHEYTGGGRISYGLYEARGFWEVFYEYSLHHEYAFPNNLDDIQQHRIRVSGGLYLPSGFDVSFYVETRVWDVEFTWVLGLTLQKSF
ncbi:MAG: hypothetical protein L6Q95_09240 [Planctomycetes bacterium]|nr:hypothetical protein [Planctomycetota bacterium]